MQSLNQYNQSPVACCSGMKYAAGVLAAVVAGGILFGCNPPAQVASPEAPEAVAPAVEFGSLVDRTAELYTTIDEGKADGSKPEVHSAMHSMQSSLKKLAVGASGSGVAADQLPELNTTVERLAELYDKIDAAEHGGEAVSYDELAPELGELIEKLKSMKP